MRPRIRLWVSLAILGILLEAGALFPFHPAVLVAGAIFFLIEVLRPKAAWPARILRAALPLLGIFTVSWATPLFSQAFIVSILFLYRSLGEESSLKRERANLLFFLFLIFLNFYVFRATLPKTFGLVFLFVLPLIFLAATKFVDTAFTGAANRKLIALILTVLSAEWLIILYFLPQGYLSLALVSLVFFLLPAEGLSFGVLGTPPKERLGWELVGGFLLAVLLLLSGGIRPR